MFVIDAHVHPLSRDLIRDSRNPNRMDREAACLDPMAAIERLIERVDHGGIVWSCPIGPAVGAGIALTNEMMREAVAAHPHRLTGFVGIDPIKVPIRHGMPSRAVSDGAPARTSRSMDASAHQAMQTPVQPSTPC